MPARLRSEWMAYLELKADAAQEAEMEAAVRRRAEQ
jgi:hypothetical protein